MIKQTFRLKYIQKLSSVTVYTQQICQFHSVMEQDYFFLLGSQLCPLVSQPHSITGAVFPSVLPPLVHTGAVKLRLAQPDVDVIVNAAEPLRKGMSTPGVWLISF